MKWSLHQMRWCGVLHFDKSLSIKTKSLMNIYWRTGTIQSPKPSVYLFKASWTISLQDGFSILKSFILYNVTSFFCYRVRFLDLKRFHTGKEVTTCFSHKWFHWPLSMSRTSKQLWQECVCVCGCVNFYWNESNLKWYRNPLQA